MVEVLCFWTILRRLHATAESRLARQASVDLVDDDLPVLDFVCHVLRESDKHLLDRCGGCLVLVHLLDILRMSIVWDFLLLPIDSR